VGKSSKKPIEIKELPKENPTARVAHWIKELDQAKKRYEKWNKRAWKVIDRYRDESDRTGSSQYNILWSNTQTLKPALYSRTPLPDVRGRFKDKYLVADQVCEVLERALSYCVDTYNFNGVMRSVVEDYVLPGRGIARVVYEVEWETVIPKVPATPISMMVDPETGQGTPIYASGTKFDDQEIGAYTDGEPEQRKKIGSEKATCRYIFWEDYLEGYARQEEDVPWKAFKAYYTRDELVKRFGDVGRFVPLDYAPSEREGKKDDVENVKKAEVWEIWDKITGNVVFICKSYKESPLEENPVPLKLEGFYPCPEPVFSIRTNDTRIPIPFYCQYQDQAQELDIITDRITKLIKQLKTSGAYNAVNDEIVRIQSAKDGELVPIMGLDPSASIENMVMFWPTEKIAQVILGLYQQRDQLVNTIYQITGLSDIIRGQSDPNETAAAQEIKGRYANMRLGDMQSELQRFARDIFRIKAEIIADQFEPETLRAITGKEVTPDMVALLRADAPRSYAVDIETDSTIQPDAQDEQKNAIELISTMSNMVQEWAPLVQAGIIPMEAAKELIGFGLRRFKNSRDIEEAFDSIGTQQQPQQQKPSPEEIQAQTDNNKLQLEQKKHEDEMQFKVQSAQNDVQLQQVKLQNDLQIQREKMHEEMELARYKIDKEMELKHQVAILDFKLKNDNILYQQSGGTH